MDSPEVEAKSVLEAETVFLLMKKGFPISRNVRAQWKIEHLDSVVSIENPDNENEETPELEIVSVLPKDKPVSWSPENNHQFLYRISSLTSIIFLAHKYKMVFSLDLSPSLATIDIQNGQVVIDEVCLATKRCLEGIIRPFYAPGSTRLMQPEIYVTIIAHTPFFSNPAQQVLVQGWVVTLENIGSLMQLIEKQLNSLEEKVAHVTGLVNQHLENLRAENEKLVGGLFEEGGTSVGNNNNNNNSNNMSFMSMVSPETSFVNMLRYGMLALSLLPDHSCAHLVIVTDGIVGVTDANIMDSVIQQLRATTVACSFLHVGSTYHPHCANASVPYEDILIFLASATLGTYFSSVPQPIPVEETDLNIYHRNFFCWQLYRAVCCERSSWDSTDLHMKKFLFHGDDFPQLLRKKQIDEKVKCTLSSLLCCRLREGYLIKKINLKEDCLEICFVLPWRTYVFLEFFISCPWQRRSMAICNNIAYTITLEATYEFLHDITCLSKKPLKSQYRQKVVSRFWAALTSLTESDNMLSHFSWSPGIGWTWYNVPDTIKSGMPVFYLPTYSSAGAIQLSDAVCPQFGQIWQPVVSQEPHQWARWLHCQRITLILCHDKPLPKHLHQANQSGRFQSVQYRQAAAALYGMLKNWATFVLVDNHTYVHFIHKEVDKPPTSFSIININCRSLCVVLNIAFAGGTDGVVRHNVVSELLEKLSKLTLPSRPTDQKETSCCTIIHKSLEKILIRYERMPSDLNTVKFWDGTQFLSRNSLIPSGNLTSTLSTYLYHGRWLWFIKKPFVQSIPAINLPKLNISAIARILSTITKIRLSEGFNFACSSAGIINMVREVEMKGPENNASLYPCTIQYILFPPHVIVSPATERDSGSDDTDDGDGEGVTEDCENIGDFQIITEIWVEPQCGHVQISSDQKAGYMHCLQYHQLPDNIAYIDEECINALLTLEHLSLLSQVDLAEKNLDFITSQGYLNQGLITRSIKKPIFTDILEGPPSNQERIHSVNFVFDTLSILPKCQQAELLFSMFDDGIHNDDEEDDNANRILIEGFLDHIKQLHNRELILTSTESHKFTEMLFNRPRDEESQIPYFNSNRVRNRIFHPQWRCFVKGVSVTHVIITILPATEKDVRVLIYPEEDVQDSYLGTDSNLHYESLSSNFDLRDTNLTPVPYARSHNDNESLSPFHNFDDFPSNVSSHTTTAHSTPKMETYHKLTEENPKRGLILPIYVYDCSLALLIDVLVDKLPSPRAKDVYRDYTFRIGEQFQEEFINLKSGGDTKPSSPEPKSEDSDNALNDQKSLMEHCKILSLAHCRCYVMAVYKSLILQRLLSFEDMEAAVEQCEENYMEINITDYLRSVCKHLSSSTSENLNTYTEKIACSEIEPFHNLIKNKFERIINVAFRPVPAHPKLYYCLPSWQPDRMNHADLQNTDSDDELEEFTFHSEAMDCKMNNCTGKVNTNTWPTAGNHNEKKFSSSESTESFISDLHVDSDTGKDHPLFLQLNCSVRNRSSLSSTPVKLLPTCVTEIMQNFDNYKDYKVTLDIICLYLPKEVLEVSLDCIPGLRTTSFCSASPHGSLGTEHSNSIGNGTDFSDVEAVQAGLSHLPHYQYTAITNLKEEIDWLLQDETATALLDKSSPTEESLKFVARHVAESNDRTSCYTEKVPLHFVFPSENSVPKFLEELTKLEINRYCIRQEGSFFYFVKNLDQNTYSADSSGEQQSEESGEQIGLDDDIYPEMEKQESTQGSDGRTKKQDSGDPPGYLSEISSIGEGQIGTDDGYDGDSSDSEDECQWLIEMDRRRKLLPNFWLILRVETTHVNVYFHCRFLELASTEVSHYQQIQKSLVSQIKAICRRVNQYLLLHRLHDTRLCDPLLEAESSEDHNWKADSFSEGSGVISHNTAISLTPGMFRCPVVWEMPFCLHPRLKTGPGRSGLSRGIKALHAVLNRLSVNNRSNMFVYREKNDNVFYLRLHEQTSEGKSLQNKLSESDERLVVSRSSSIASLSQARGTSLLSDQSIIDDTRPRVRSFGEKESDVLSKAGDSIVLMVHGISEAGPEIRCELVQVLQNRLDDAVLEVLSVMLARNPMCKLSPADVHFIQKPFRSPESIVRLSVQPHCLTHMCALGYYLRQNVLQFLYIPKHTDPRAHYHFQDYSQPENSVKRIPESEIFLYNQTHSSGSRGIACIAMGIVNSKGELLATEKNASRDSSFPESPKVQDFENIVLTSLYDVRTELDPDINALIEFRIWKQGRVNLESLIQKLRSAVRHAIWDLVTEYNFLPTLLTVPLNADSLDDQDLNSCNKSNSSAETDAIEALRTETNLTPGKEINEPDQMSGNETKQGFENETNQRVENETNQRVEIVTSQRFEDETNQTSGHELIQKTENETVQMSRNEDSEKSGNEIGGLLGNETDQLSGNETNQASEKQIIQMPGSEIIQKTKYEIPQNSEVGISQKLRDESEDGIMQDSKNESVQTVKDESNKTSKDDVIQTFKDEIQTPKSKTNQASTSEIKQISKDEITPVPTNEIVLEIVQTPKEEIVLESKNEIIQIPKTEIIQASKPETVQASEIIQKESKNESMQTVKNEVSKDETVKFETNQINVDEPVKNTVNEESNKNANNLGMKQYELGEKGKLHKMYHVTLPFWFQFALEINVPAVKKHVVTLDRRHSLAVTLRELQNIIHNNASDTCTKTFVQNNRQPFINSDMEEDILAFKIFEGSDNISRAWLKKAQEQETKDEETYLPYDFFKEDQEIYVTSILVARNFQQWKASFAQTIESEKLVPKDQKLLQKFNPLILETNFVPRQRLLLAKIQSKNIVMYMYNWSKERSEKLIKQTTNLGMWLSSRSTLHSNIIMQKLGIFHHQPVRTVDPRDQNESGHFHITDMESLAKFPQASPARIQSGKNTSFSWNHLMGEVMRDAKPNAQRLPTTTDPVVKAAYDFQELRQRKKKRKEDLNRLYSMWQSKNTVPNIPISTETLNTFKQHSRLIHYCHTPLLFLPDWRLKSAATRDYLLTPSSSSTTDGITQLNTTIQKSKDEDASNQVINEWHRELCFHIISEYKQYLQILGFNPVQTETVPRTEREDVQNQVFYLKKSMLGGILLFEIQMSEPFFTIKLRVIECSRLQAKANSALVNQFMLSFIDACDEIKINMHLHSFTYDYHLRSIHSYIAGTGHWSLRHGYHLTNFLDDFNKYYSKAPNYARNLVYSGDITISNLATPARTLYSYLLSHDKAYGMQVFSMSDDSNQVQDSEYVLVKLQSTPLVSYCDAQDIKYTDDFDVALIVSRVEDNSNFDSNEITLKYYLMLTSKRELYPKRDLENNKIGKFQTVHSVAKSVNNSQLESPAESSPASTTLPSSRKHSKCEFKSSSNDLQEQISEMTSSATYDEENDDLNAQAPTPPPVPSSPLTRSILGASSSNLVLIRQESINYFGYYSSHEQLMQQTIMSQAQTAREHITSMIEQGAVHCRTHLLWNKLLENRTSMSYAEFTELRSLAVVEPLSSLDSRLSPLINQPVTWYQALAKVLQNKYQDYHKQFNTPDGNVTHHLILHPSYVQAFMMLTIDLHTSRGELCAVYRNSIENTSSPFSVGDIYNLIEGFVNACCFHLWMGLYN